MDFKQFRSFEAVVRFGSFTKAAESLFISQPTISTHINQLEEEFNARLIYRTTKSIEITPKGMELYDFISRVLMMENALKKRWSEEAEGTIDIGASTIPSAYILPEILPRFLEDRPGIRFSIHQSDSQGIIEGLLNGSFEIGLVGMNTPTKGISFTPFFEDSMVLVTPASDHYRRLYEKGADPESLLLSEPVILRKTGSGTQKAVDRYFQDKGLNEDDINVVARLNDQESIKNLVVGGLGISIVSEKAAENYKNEGQILTFPLPAGKNVRKLYIASPEFYGLRKQTEDFVNFITTYYNRGCRIR